MVFYLGQGNQNKSIFNAKDTDFLGRQLHQHMNKTLF